MTDLNPDNLSPFGREKRESERERKREWVLRACVKMFNARGFGQTSLDDVAASLEISKPTIYSYLGNKDQVLFECVKRGMEQIHQAAQSAHDAPASGIDKLCTFLRKYAEIAMDDFGRCVILTEESSLSAKSRTEFRKLKRDVDNALRSLIVVGMDDGSIARRNIKFVTFALMGALSWPARWYREGGELGADAIAAELVAFLSAGLTPRDEVAEIIG